jgi:hypothetical protein
MKAYINTQFRNFTVKSAKESIFADFTVSYWKEGTLCQQAHAEKKGQQT